MNWVIRTGNIEGAVLDERWIVHEVQCSVESVGGFRVTFFPAKEAEPDPLEDQGFCRDMATLDCTAEAARWFGERIGRTVRMSATIKD